MKKTLVALLAMAGAAFAADYTTETIWTAQFGSAYGDAGYTTNLTSPGKFWDAGKLATAAGAQTKSDGRIHMAGGTYGDWSADFEMTIELTLTGANITAGHISEMKAGSTGNWLCLGVDTAGALTLTGSAISNVTSVGTVTTGTEYTLTLTKIGTELTMTVGDASVTATMGDYSGIINNITLGGNTGGGNRVPVLVSGIEMSSVTVNPSAPAVPEPTTATLSLLALAGLAARRRR